MMHTQVNEKIVTSGKVHASTEEVWQKLAAFGGTHKFVPELIEDVEVQGHGVGALRHIHIKGGGCIVEELTALQERDGILKFVIKSTPMTIQEYEGMHIVKALGENVCEVVFQSVYRVDAAQREEMSKLIREFQTTFISNLHK
ncbi:MAG TPA: SRPBCC family protein [Cytophagales bacterium]|nr:SRPBCC family protein [Cytophagales bacterium]